MLLAWSWLFCFQPASAQSTDTTNASPTKEARTEEIQVEDSPLFTPATALTAYETLSKADLANLNVLTVADAVKQLPSVMLKDYGGIGGLKTISVRSLGAAHTAVQLDGIKISDAQTGQVDLGRFSIQNLEQVELAQGTPPDLLAPARAYVSASMLNLVSKIESFHRSKAQGEWRLGSQAGSFGQFNQSASLYAKLSKQATFGIDAERISANGEYDYRLQNGRETLNLTRRNTDLRALRAETDFALELSHRSRIFIKTYFYDSERGLPNAVAIRPNPDLIEVSRQRLYLQDAFAQTRFVTQMNDKFQVSVSGKFAYNFLRFTEPALDARNPDTDDRYIQRELYGTASAAYRFTEKTSLSVASDLAFNTLNASLFNAAQPTRWTAVTAFALTHQAGAVWLEGNLATTLVRETTAFGTAAPNRQATTSTIAVGYKPFRDEGLRLRASYRNTFRMPTFNDLYYTRVGNSDLRPEYARQWNVGTGYEKVSQSSWQSFALRIDGFGNDVTDKILAVPRDAFNWSMQNIGAVKTLGFDARVESAFRLFESTLSLTANYTRQTVVDVSHSSLTPNQQIPYTPKELGSLMLVLTHGSWSIGYVLAYTGFRFTLPENTAENVLPAFWISDVNLSMRIALGAFSATLKAEISNLFDARYEVIQFFPMPSRNYRLSVNLMREKK